MHNTYYPVAYNWFIFKTNVRSKENVDNLRLILQSNTTISEWSVDTEDCDCVLRVEATSQFPEERIIEIIRRNGFQIEPLLD